MNINIERAVENAANVVSSSGSLTPTQVFELSLQLVPLVDRTQLKTSFDRCIALTDERCTPFTVASAAAIAAQTPIAEVLFPWQEFALGLLCAAPPYPAAVAVQVATCCAKFYVDSSSLVDRVFSVASCVLEASEDGKMSFANAVEVLARAASYVVSIPEDGPNSSSTLLNAQQVLINTSLRALDRSHRDITTPQLITRRILVPLLTASRTLTTGEKSSVVRNSLSAAVKAPMMALLKGLAAKNLFGEVIILHAAMFEYFFPMAADVSSIAPAASFASQGDYRNDPFLWNCIIAALRLACTTAGAGLDAGRRATIQLQALYLMKRIVALTQSHTPLASSPLRTLTFHEHFHWKGNGVSAAQWEAAFLLFETLNEYGLHIIQPALSKLDASLVGPDGLEAIWIELIFTKIVQHANVGVRKVGLRRLWQMDIASVRRLSPEFVFGTVFAAAADVRLCSEMERMISPSNFLDSKGFDGRSDYELPHILPTADHASLFYAALVRAISENSGGIAALRSALTIIMGTATMDATRFHMSMLVRTLQAMASAATSAFAHAANEEVIMDAALAARVAELLKDVLQDKHPYFLECRLNAIAASFILELGRCDMSMCQPTDADRVRTRYLQLLAMATVLGDTGGKALASIDAAGAVGSLGAALTVRDLVQQVSRIAADSNIGRHALVDSIVTASQSLGTQVRHMLTSAKGPIDIPAIKEALLMADVAEFAVKADTASAIIAEVISVAARPYAQVAQVLVPLLILGEFAANVADASTYFDETTLREALDGVESRAVKYLVEATSLIFSVQHDASQLSDVSWDGHRTEEWDSLCCGIFALHKLLDTSKTVTNWEFDISRQVDILESISAMSAAVKPGPQQLAYIVVMRNAAKLVYTVAAAAAQSVNVSTRGEAMGALRIPNGADLGTQLMELAPLHLWSADVPCSLTSHTWGTIMSQYFRYVYNTIYSCAFAVSQEQPRTTAAATFLTTVKEYALSQLDCCSASNLASVYDMLFLIVVIADPQDDSEESCPPPLCEDHERRNIVRLLVARQKDTQRREFFRCAAMANFALPAVQESSESRAQLAKLAVAATGDENDRVVFFVAAAIVVDFLKNPADRWECYKDFLLQMTVFVNGGHDEDEFEACVAAMEPAFASWPDSLRERSPPTIRMHSMARAMCLSAILWACHENRALAVSLSVELVRWNTHHPVIKKEPCMPNSNTHRCRIRLWQLICAIRPIVSAAHPDSSNEEVVAGLRTIVTAMIDECMPINNMGSVRRYLELYLIAAFGQCHKLSDVLEGMLDDYTQRPQVMGSIALISFHAARDALRKCCSSLEDKADAKEQYEAVYTRLFRRLLRMCSSHQYLLRIVSHIAVYHLVKTQLTQSKIVVGDDAMALYHYIEKAPECIRFREKHETFVVFEGEEALSPAQIFCFQRKEAAVWLKESIPASVFERMRFLESELSCILGATTPFERLRSRALCTAVHADPALFNRFNQFPYIPHDPRHSPANHYLDYTFELLTSLDDPLENKDAPTDNIQRKATSWWNSEVYNELHPRALGINKRQSLVIVGSLLENPVNIAGLCRCGEIFTVEKVTVPDKKVFDHPHFIAAARSAELWLPWDEVVPANLPMYLSACQDAGYTLVGIEQTANSVSMATFEFPKKCVIVLGSEGHGIPAPLLPLLDVCVEIPQYGLIRSLNVHVTGAVVMYEYTKQFLMATMHEGAQHPSSIGTGAV